MDLTSVAADSSRMTNGAWWNFETGVLCKDNTPHAEQACFRIAYAHTELARQLEIERQPFLVDIRANRFSDEDSSRVYGTALAKVSLRDWQNVSLGGEPWDYTEERAIELMTDSRWLFVRRFVETAMQTDQAYMEVEEEQAKGN